MSNFCEYYSLSDVEELSLYDPLACSKCTSAVWMQGVGGALGRGGLCCKEKPCEVSPRQFDSVTVKTVKDFLETNKWALIEVLGRGYYRIRAKGDWDQRVMKNECPVVSYHFDDFQGGRCMLLEDRGCVLPEAERPDGGRLLKPELRSDGMADCKFLRHISWKPYQEILCKAAQELRAEYNCE